MTLSPFPGMDPYLEGPDLWPDVHARLANIIAEQLAPLLAPKYVVELNTQIVIDRVWDEPPEVLTPDVAVTRPGTEGGVMVMTSPTAPAPLRLAIPLAIPTRLISVYIRKQATKELVTVIELLSPVNKRPGVGRGEYLDKRMSYLETGAHLVEIDLLRKWPRMPLEGRLPRCDYLVMVSVAYQRPTCDVWPIRLPQPLPAIPIPLRRPDPAVPLDLGLALRTAYERGRYDLRIDYSQPPDPPLSADDAAWAGTLLVKREA